MKFLVILLVTAVCAGRIEPGNRFEYRIPKHVTIFGDLKPHEIADFKQVIGHEIIFEHGDLTEVTRKTVMFPNVETSEKYIIKAIAFHDSVVYPSEVMIVDGGIGQNYVVLQIESQPGKGIDSFVRFYGTKQ